MSGTKRIPVPFLKWVGGKRQLMPELLKRIPDEYERYFEPFIGGGALFFSLQPKNAYISDVNLDLVEAYQVVKERVEELIKDLAQHKYEKDYYYSIRDIDRSVEFKSWSKIEKVSRLIFLNKTCFNGLYRVNSKGEFNVPFGKYKNPTILDADNLRACSVALQTTEIKQGSYQEIISLITKNDFVYFDPPYVPLNQTSNFTAYSKDGFGEACQIALRDFCKELEARGVKFMLSNSSADLVLDLYKDFNIEFVEAARAVNSKASKRGKVKEVIVRNFENLVQRPTLVDKEE